LVDGVGEVEAQASGGQLEPRFMRELFHVLTMLNHLTGDKQLSRILTSVDRTLVINVA
jgi:hypothetical protein